MNTHHHQAGHHHSHAHSQPRDYGRSFLIGIGLNVAFIAAEIIYGLKADSLSLLADAGHNVSDVLGLAMAWVAALLSRKRASERFTYGLQSASIFASLANALLLLVAVGGIGWEAFHRFEHPALPATGTMMAVAALGVAVNGITAWLFHGDSHDLNIRGAFLHMAADALVSLGVVLSGLLIMATGWQWVDPVMSLGIVLMIIWSTWGLLRSSTTLALQAVPEGVDIQRVREFLSRQPGVTEVHDLHIWAMSTTGIALSAHLVMPSGHPGDAFLVRLTHDLDHEFRINHSTLQIEMGQIEMDDTHSDWHRNCDHG